MVQLVTEDYIQELQTPKDLVLTYAGSSFQVKVTKDYLELPITNTQDVEFMMIDNKPVIRIIPKK